MLKLGLVGWGYWGRNYAKYFDTNLDAHLVSVCDLRSEMLADAKRLCPHIHTTKDAGDLANGKLDGVIIASPASVHHKLAKLFIRARIPLLIEKPLTDSYASAKEIETLAKKTQTKVLVGHTFLYNQSVRYLKKEIDAGSLGRLYYLEFRRQSYGPIRDDVNIVWDLAPHDIAITRYLLGDIRPISVYAKSKKFSRIGMEDIAVIVMEYPNNVLVNINIAWFYPVKIRTLTLLSDKKMVLFEDTNITEPVKIYDISLQYPKEYDPSGGSFRLGDVHIPRMPPIDPLATQLRHFVAYIKDEEVPFTPVSDGVEVAIILEAINESLRKGAEVNINQWIKRQG